MRTAQVEFVLTTTSRPSSSGLPLSTFLVNFVIEMIVRIILSLRVNSDIDICSEMKLSNFEYVDDMERLSEDPNK